MLRTLRAFPTAFYVANAMEIFERMAWYGFYALASLYITGSTESGGLGFSDEQRGFITGVIPFVLYLLPVVTGALADRFGYKRTFFLAFAIMTPAYFIMGQVSNFWFFFLAFLAVAVGAALFKPVVTGTVARVTSPATKALGFGVFYMIVNVGGFLGPLVATVVRGWGWNYVFLMSSIWIGLNFIPLLLFYREPQTPQASDELPFRKKMAQTWRDMTEVLGNTRFFIFVAALLVALMLAGGGQVSWTRFFFFTGGWALVNLLLDGWLRARSRRHERIVHPGEPEPLWSPMRLGNWRFGLYLLIISGFWTEFNQMFLTMPLYIRDYVDTIVIQDGVRAALAALPLVGEHLVAFWNWALVYLTEDGQIKPENIINLDALSIVFFQVLITALVARWKPFATMIAGTLLTALAMALGVHSSLGWICILTIFVFAIGEMMASPKSQEYVARIAPPGKEAMYMGYYFVSIALGNLFGGLLSGQAYATFANLETGNGHPEQMWRIFAAIAVVTALALHLFNRYLAPSETTPSSSSEEHQSAAASGQ